MAMAQRLVLAAFLLPLATGHLNVLISQAEVKKLLGKPRTDFDVFLNNVNCLLCLFLYSFFFNYSRIEWATSSLM